MKLELKHIAPYLPYKVLLKTDLYTCKLLSTEQLFFYDKIRCEHVFKNIEGTRYAKLILKPLSQAIIPYSGIPIDQEEYQEPNDLFIDNNGNVSMDFQAGGITVSWAIKDMQSFMENLFKDHYDVFGLIKSGLAIDINSLES